MYINKNRFECKHYKWDYPCGTCIADAQIFLLKGALLEIISVSNEDTIKDIASKALQDINHIWPIKVDCPDQSVSLANPNPDSVLKL